MGTWCHALTVSHFLSKNINMMYHHAKYRRHREKVKLRGKDRNQLLVKRSLGLLNINYKGTYFDDIEKNYQCYGLVAATKTNISINQLI